MVAKKIAKTKIELANAPAQQLRRVWLAGLGAFSLTRKHGGQWFGRFAEQGRDAIARGVTFARETLVDSRAHAIGALAPITARAEKRFDVYVAALGKQAGRALHGLGVPSTREIDELSRRITALSRRLKAAK